MEPPKEKTPPKYDSKKISDKLMDMQYAREMINKKIFVPKEESPNRGRRRRRGTVTGGDASSIGGATNFTQILD